MRRQSKSDRRRIALVGIDGFSPEWIERFLDDGSMPSLARIRRLGATVPLISTLPATTPVAWASIATGCHPSATGIEGFLLHRPGNRLDQRISGTYATRCRREPVWETATLWGKRAFVVKFPLSYPSTTAALRIDGAAGWGGIRCLHEAAPSGVSHSPGLAGKAAGHFVPDDKAWTGSALLPLRWTGRLEIPTLWGGAPVTLAAAVTAQSPPRLVLSPDGDWRRSALLAPGAMSDPIIVTAEGRRGECACATRFKLLELEAAPGDTPRIRLFNSPVHELGEHSHPAGAAARHLETAGPIEEQTEPTLLLEGLIDYNTHMDRCRLNTEWLQRVSASILENEDWDLFMVHIHIVDWAHHLLHGCVDPRHPLHDPDERPAAVERLRAHYRLADALVGTVLGCIDEGGDIMVLGDHGQDLHHTTVRLNQAFAEQGWLSWSAPETDEVDWSRTRVYAAGNYVYLNLAGREPTGIVLPDEAPGLIAEVIRHLRELTDPRTGEQPVHSVGTKADFATLGADGEGTGDVIFCLKSGYHGRNDQGPVFELTRPGHEFTSGHDHFWPLDPSIETRLYAMGPSFTPGRFPDRRSVIDVAPTLCAVLGIDPPDGCQGRVIEEMLAPQHGAAEIAFAEPSGG